MIEVSLSAAIICFLGTCYPALVGETTPVGTFSVTERLTVDRGYEGNVIQFYETDTDVYAIHRIWNLDPKQQREKRIRSNDPSYRKITAGCINVQPVVFEKLLDCCMDMKLKISP